MERLRNQKKLLQKLLQLRKYSDSHRRYVDEGKFSSRKDFSPKPKK